VIFFCLFDIIGCWEEEVGLAFVMVLGAVLVLYPCRSVQVIIGAEKAESSCRFDSNCARLKTPFLLQFASGPIVGGVTRSNQHYVSQSAKSGAEFVGNINDLSTDIRLQSR